MPIQWMEYKGQRILYADYRGLKTEEKMLENLKVEDEFYSKSSVKILSLNDYRDTFISKTFMDKISHLGKKHKGKTAKSAILGISGIKHILLNAYTAITNEPAKCFNDELSAKEYLVKD